MTGQPLNFSTICQPIDYWEVFAPVVCTQGRGYNQQVPHSMYVCMYVWLQSAGASQSVCMYVWLQSAGASQSLNPALDGPTVQYSSWSKILLLSTPTNP